MVNGDVASVQIAPRNRQIVNGAVRRLGFAPIPGRRSNSPLTDLAWDSSPGHRVGTPWLTTTVLARAPKDRRLGCVPTLPAATSSAASEFNPGASGCERAVRQANPPAITVPSCAVVEFDWHDLHTGVIATHVEWRYLIRVTETDYLQPCSDLRRVIRTQQNVYIPTEFGW
jgi:hypothetical protein